MLEISLPQTIAATCLEKGNEWVILMRGRNFRLILISLVAVGAAGCSNEILHDGIQKVRLSKYGFFATPMIFETEVKNLTKQQLNRLQEIEVLAHIFPDEFSTEDSTTYSLTLTDDEGEKFHYIANVNNRGAANAVVVDRKAVLKFAKAIDCFSFNDNLSLDFENQHEDDNIEDPGDEEEAENADEVGDGFLESDPEDAIDWDQNPYCSYGLFANYSGSETWFEVNISASDLAYRIDIHDGFYRCDIKFDTRLQIFENDGTTLLADSNNTNGRCPRISYDFGEPGSYLILITVNPSQSAGDFFLHAYPQN